MKARNILIAALVLATAIGMSACSSGGGKSGTMKVALANSFAGNTWRAQMVQEFENACQTTYKAEVTCLPAADGKDDLATQVSQITDFITQGVKIIIIDAKDATGLNAVIKQARDAGITVIDFDGITTSPDAIHLVEDQTTVGKLGGEWLASQLKSGDTIISLDGISGVPVSDQRKAGADAALEAAGIKIVGRGDTKWDRATAATVAAGLLAKYPDVKGIYSQGGDASLGAIDAMKQLNMQILPIPGEASNGFLKAWQALSKDQPGFQSWAFASPPKLVVDALDAGIKAAKGTGAKPGDTINLDVPVITADDLANQVHADLNDSLWLPTLLPADFLQKNYKN